MNPDFHDKSSMSRMPSKTANCSLHEAGMKSYEIMWLVPSKSYWNGMNSFRNETHCKIMCEGPYLECTVLCDLRNVCRDKDWGISSIYDFCCVLYSDSIKSNHRHSQPSLVFYERDLDSDTGIAVLLSHATGATLSLLANHVWALEQKNQTLTFC